MNHELYDCVRRIQELKAMVAGLAAEEAALRANGDEAGADELALKIKAYNNEITEKSSEYGEILEQEKTDAVSRKLVEDYWNSKYRAILTHLLDMVEFWMRTHYIEINGEVYDYWGLYLQDHDGLAGLRDR